MQLCIKEKSKNINSNKFIWVQGIRESRENQRNLFIGYYYDDVFICRSISICNNIV